MAQKDLIAARAKAEGYKADLTAATGLLKERLKPANLASDAWHVVRDRGMAFSGRGVKAASDRPAAAGGAVAALALFFLRKPLAHLLSWTFGKDRKVPGAVKADLTHASDDYDLTAPVIVKN